MRSLEQEICNLKALCQLSLDSEFKHIGELLVDAPKSPEAWFALLQGFPHDPACAQALERLCRHAAHLGYVAGTVERYAVLQAYLEGLPLILGLPVHESLNWQYCATCRLVVGRDRRPANYLRRQSDTFYELAFIVTLRRYSAGQVSFDIMGTPRTWLLRVHPFAVPGLLRAIVLQMHGMGPILMPHLNWWRSMPFAMLEKENSRSFWRMAKTMERQPEIKGVVAASWMYSVAAAETAPHLAWMRDFYEKNGAYLVDMHLAPERAGFLVGSDSRRKLYAEGKFRPRETLVLWPRANILAWAKAYENSTLEGHSEPRTASPRPARSQADAYSRSDANKTLSSGQLTLVNLERLMTYKPRQYFALVFLLPCLLVAIAAGAGIGLSAIPPSVLFGAVFIWLFQYFFLQ